MGNAPSVTLDTYGHVFDERDPGSRFDAAEAIEAARGEFVVREMYAGEVGAPTGESVYPASDDEALFRTRTGDPLLTMEVVHPSSVSKSMFEANYPDRARTRARSRPR